jgi:hypothetical protein
MKELEKGGIMRQEVEEHQCMARGTKRIASDLLQQIPIVA